MHLRHSEIQGLRLSGKELKENVVLKDGTRAKPHEIISRVELSDKLFTPMFLDGEEVMMHLEDLTEGRLRGTEKEDGRLIFEAKVFYGKQDKPVIITVGTEYVKGSFSRQLKHYQKYWDDVCGFYEFYLERRTDTPMKTSK